MTTPAFCVIIPAYNAARTLGSTLESVLNQSFADFEILIIDDGSSDDTLRVAMPIAACDRRIRLVSQPNAGVSAARNFAATLTKARYLAFLDADDQWSADKLAQHHALHEDEPMLDASFGRVEFCADQNGALAAGRTSSKVPQGHLGVADIIAQNPVCTASNFVIKRRAFEALGGFVPDLRYAEDQEILARLLSTGGTMRGIDAALVRYRLSEGGLSCDFQAMLDGWRSFASTWLDADQLAQAEAAYCRYLARRALRSGADIAVARSFVRRGLAADRAGFMADGARSILTLGGVVAASVMPARLRRTVFA